MRTTFSPGGGGGDEGTPDFTGMIKGFFGGLIFLIPGFLGVIQNNVKIHGSARVSRLRSCNMFTPNCLCMLVLLFWNGSFVECSIPIG